MILKVFIWGILLPFSCIFIFSISHKKISENDGWKYLSNISNKVIKEKSLSKKFNLIKKVNNKWLILFIILFIAYIFIGIIQFKIIFSEISYLFQNKENIVARIFKDNFNFSLEIASLILLIEFYWILYGNPLFSILRLYKIRAVFDNIVSIVFRELSDSKRIFRYLKNGTIHIVHFVIYGGYIIYTLNSDMVYKCSKYIPVLILDFFFIAIFYYFITKFLTKLFFLKNSNNKNEEVIYKTLKNNTYMYSLIIYAYGLIFKDSSSDLLNAITILFLFDTYLQNKHEIEK